MADESAFNHGNNVANNYGTVHQYLGTRPPRKPLWQQLKLRQVVLVGGFVTATLGAWGFYARGGHKPLPHKAYYCASGWRVKYHASPTCQGLSSCNAHVASITMARVKQQHMEPCLLCH